MTAPALSQAELVVRVIAQTAVDNEKYFCDLDAVAGDGDSAIPSHADSKLSSPTGTDWTTPTSRVC